MPGSAPPPEPPLSRIAALRVPARASIAQDGVGVGEGDEEYGQGIRNFGTREWLGTLGGKSGTRVAVGGIGTQSGGTRGLWA